MTKFAPLPRPPMPQPMGEQAHVAVILRLNDPNDDILIRHIRLLRDCVALAQQRWQFEVEAAVVLPGELQMLCRFDDIQFGAGDAVKLITTAFARHVPHGGTVVWSDENEMHEVGAAVAALRRDLIENAPVRAGLARAPQDWPHSSVHRAVPQVGKLGVDVA